MQFHYSHKTFVMNNTLIFYQAYKITIQILIKGKIISRVKLSSWKVEHNDPQIPRYYFYNFFQKRIHPQFPTLRNTTFPSNPAYRVDSSSSILLY